MSFKKFLENSELEDELNKLKDELFSFDSDVYDYKELEDEDEDLIDPEDIDDVWDTDEDGEDENYEDGEEITESTKNLSKKDLLKKQYKNKSRIFILNKLQGNEKNGKLSPLTVAMFKTSYEFNDNIGKFGKWVKRKNKGEFKKKNPLSKLVKGYKKKAKRMRKLLKKGNIQSKIARSSKRNAIKLGGKSVDLKGRITNE